jgi:hypothetical protein
MRPGSSGASGQGLFAPRVVAFRHRLCGERAAAYRHRSSQSDPQRESEPGLWCGAEKGIGGIPIQTCGRAVRGQGVRNPSIATVGRDVHLRRRPVAQDRAVLIAEEARRVVRAVIDQARKLQIGMSF